MAAAALAGILSSAIGGLQNAQARDMSHESIQNALETLGRTRGYADQMYGQGQDILNSMLAANQGLYGNPQDAAEALMAAQQGINAVNPYSAGEFSYDKDLADFYDNALGLRMNAANDAIAQSQALGGSLFSSDTADKLVAQAQVLGSQAYKDALQAYQTDKGLEQSIWAGNEAARQAAANSEANLAQMRYGVASDTAGNLSAGQNAYYDALLGLNDDYWQNKTDLDLQAAQLQAMDPGGRSGVAKVFDPMGILPVDSLMPSFFKKF